MPHYEHLLVGLVLLTASFGPGIIPQEPSHQVAKTPEDCRDYPLPRPVPANFNNPAVNGTVKQLDSNGSIIDITYRVLKKSKDRTVTVQIPDGGTLVDHNGAKEVGPNKIRANLSRARFSIRYSIGTPVIGNRSQNLTYAHGRNWIIAPTPIHRGADFVLKPENQGFIGLNILYLGQYSIHKKKVGCQELRIIKPSASNINADRRLDILASAARRFDIGHTYDKVTFFASPKKLGEDSGYFSSNLEGGFVPNFENEIVVYDRAPLRDPKNVWVHEYIHTRQFTPDEGEFEWFTEASATYYAARLSLELGLISEAQYNAEFAEFVRYNPETRLVDADNERVAYTWGAVVLARLDTSLENRGKTTLFEIYRDMNRGGGPNLPGFTQFESHLMRSGELSRLEVNWMKEVMYGYETVHGQKIYIGEWYERPLTFGRNFPYVIPLLLFQWFVKVAGIGFIAHGLFVNLSNWQEVISEFIELLNRD